MGTHATLRIHKNNDYIELHSRWDGFPQEMSDNLLNIENHYSEFLSLLKSNFNKYDGLIFLNKWINNFDKLIENYKKNKSIELTTLLFSTRSFSHFSPLPHQAEESLLDYWGKGSPDLDLNLEDFSFLGEVYDEENDDYITNEIPEIIINSKKIEDKYKILRIYSKRYQAYLDFKFFDLDNKDVIKDILTLPFLFKELTTILENSDLTTNILVGNFFYPLSSFYNSKNKSSRYYRFGERNEKELISDLKSSNPFDLFVNQFGIHLMLGFAGKLLPLTNAEAATDYKPDIVLNLDTDIFSTISFDTEGYNLNIEEIKEYLKICEFNYSKKFNVSPINFDYIELNDNFVSFNYEMSLFKIFKNII